MADQPISEAAAIAALHTRLATASAEEVLDLARSCPVKGARAAATRITRDLHRLREHLAAVVGETCRQAETDAASARVIPAPEPMPVDAAPTPAEPVPVEPAAPEIVQEAEEAPVPMRPASARTRRRSAPSKPRKPRTATGPAARRTGTSGLGADTVGDRGWTFTIHPIGDDEAAAVRRLCERHGTTPDEVAELIAMLGISAQETQEAIAG